MSSWSYCTGLIVYSRRKTLSGEGEKAKRLSKSEIRRYIRKIKKLLGNTVDAFDPEGKWDKCTVPCGSEGSLQFVVRQNIAYNKEDYLDYEFFVIIFGSLRDFPNDAKDITKVKEWFEKVTVNQDCKAATLEFSAPNPDLHFILCLDNDFDKEKITEIKV